MQHDDKRQIRKLKRDIKKAGNKKRRQRLKSDLRDNPTEAHWSEESVGKSRSETLNGLDEDSTRQRDHQGGE